MPAASPPPSGGTASGDPASPDASASETPPPIALGGGQQGASPTPDLGGAGSIGSSGGGGSSPTLLLGLVLLAFIVGGGFAIFAARRRRPQEEERTLAAAAEATPAAIARATPVSEAAEDSGVPRWRRASVRAARSASDRGPAGPTYQLAFTAAAVEGAERRLVRYRVVRMMDGPDEIRSQEVGQLEENDEVEVLGRYAGYVQVRTPVGTEGWVHRTTLGPPIGSEEPAADVGPPEFDLESAFDLQRARKATIATVAPVALPAVVGSAPPAAPAPVAQATPPKRASTRRSRKVEPST